jgi:hypothetical protein
MPVVEPRIVKHSTRLGEVVTTKPVLRKDDMSNPSNEVDPEVEHDLEAQRQQIAEVDDELDARSDGEGLAAEAGRGEETGLAEG